jgi:hypothetical protein
MAINWDPAEEIAYREQRTKGCFACVFSKYGIPDNSKLLTKRSYCEQIEAGMLKADYPNEDTASPCFIRRKKC